MAWRNVAALDALKDGGVVGVEIDGTPLALFRMGEEVYATHGICTHALGLLKDGWVENGTIECPIHQGVFDIRTGEALSAPLTEDLRTYAVKVEGGEVYVNLETQATPDNIAAEAGAPREEGRQEEGRQEEGPHLVVVGAGQAAAAAIRAARSSGFAGSITLLGAEPHLPYERPPLSKEFLSGRADFASCMRLTAQDAEEFGVVHRPSTRAVGVDPQAKTVTLTDGSTLAYDALLLATGGRARRLAIPGGDLPGVLYLRTLEDAQAIAKGLKDAKRVAVVGGGFIGMELASAAIDHGLSVTVLERAGELMARLMPPALGRAFRQLAQKAGVEVRRGVAVEAITTSARGLVLSTSDGMVETDLVLVGVGLESETELAASAGCAVEGGVIVDAGGRTTIPGIWAAGDCTLHHVAVNGRRRRLESWQNAEDQGTAAGRSIAGVTEAAPDKAPWFWTDQFGLNIQMLGTPGADDLVAVTGTDGAPGAIYRTLDPGSHRLIAVIAFSDPAAIRAARAELASNAPFDLKAAHARLLTDTEPQDDEDMNAEPAARFAKKHV